MKGIKYLMTYGFFFFYKKSLFLYVGNIISYEIN